VLRCASAYSLLPQIGLAIIGIASAFESEVAFPGDRGVVVSAVPKCAHQRQMLACWERSVSSSGATLPLALDFTGGCSPRYSRTLE